MVLAPDTSTLSVNFDSGQRGSSVSPTTALSLAGFPAGFPLISGIEFIDLKGSRVCKESSELGGSGEELRSEIHGFDPCDNRGLILTSL